MSRGPEPVVVQWSPGAIEIYDPATRQSSRYAGDDLNVNGLAGRSAVIAVSRRAVFLRTVRLPDAKDEDVRQIIRLRLTEFFPAAGTELAFDFYRLDDSNSEGRLFAIAAMPAAELKRCYDQVSDAGLKIVRVLLSANAAATQAAQAGLKDAIVVQLEVGGLALDVVQDGKVVYSRATNAAAEPGAEVGRTEAAANVDGLPVLAVDLAVPGAEANAKGPGLEAIARNYESLPIHLEPLEAVEARAKKGREGRRRLALLFVLAAIAFAVPVYLDFEDAGIKARRTEGRLKAELKQLTDAQALAEADLNRAAKIGDVVQRAFEPAQSPSDILKILTNETPDGLWLSGVTFERGKPLQIRGTALKAESVSEYLRRLASQRRFRDVRLVFSTDAKIDETNVVQFSMTAFPVGNLPIVEQEVRRR